MIGDGSDFAARIRAVLPDRWFPSETPVLGALLAGLGNAWAAIYGMLAYVRAQTRLATATDSDLDLISQDFFGSRLPRSSGETDTAYRARVIAALAREHATRQALSDGLESLTGAKPIIFEPSRPADTGGYSTGGLAYGVAGALGDLSLPFQVFVTVRRPPPAGISTIAGYGTAGPLARASLSQAGAQLSDAVIHDTITSLLPTARVAWTRITN
jgi:hypothetical protein